MKLLHKISVALLIVRRSSGLRGKIGAFRQLLDITLRTHRRGNGKPIPPETVSANAWADYHLLSFISRDVNIRIVEAQQRRIWFIVPELNASVVFGGYIALFQFMSFVQKLGLQIGIFVLKPLGERKELMKTFEGNAFIHGVLSDCEIEGIGIARTLRLNNADMLVCYNWTTALVAAKMARSLDDPAYYYFVQEDERIFYPNDSYRFLAESIFHQSPRPRLICNSQKLLDHFKTEGLIDTDTIVGVFEQGLPPSELPDRSALAGKSPRRLVFYGRPEDHAKRNLMIIALMALVRAKREGAFNAEPWEFFMIGSPQMGEGYDLDGLRITCLPNQGYDAYRQTLTAFDVGICLMHAPHPSVPPFEMVRSGVITVVNTTRGRPEDWYRAISANFEPGAPTLNGLAQAIKRAAARVGDVDSRLTASSTYHPESWDESFAHLPRVLGHGIFDTERNTSSVADSQRPGGNFCN